MNLLIIILIIEVATRKIHVEACNINLQGSNGDFLFLPLNCMKEDRNIKHVTLQEHRRSTDWQHFSFAANFETKKVVAQWKNFEAAKDMLLNQTTTPWAQAVAHWRHVLDFFFFFFTPLQPSPDSTKASSSIVLSPAFPRWTRSSRSRQRGALSREILSSSPKLKSLAAAAGSDWAATRLSNSFSSSEQKGEGKK